MTHPLATKDPILSPNLGQFKIDQIAYAAYDEADVRAIKYALQLTEADWVADEVRAEGAVFGVSGLASNRARLEFNYDFGIELEILRYLGGPNYLQQLGIKPRGIAHIGAHVEPGVSFRHPTFYPLVQQVVTLRHTNQFLIDTGRTYRYSIYDTRTALGHCFKLIERLQSGETQDAS